MPFFFMDVMAFHHVVRSDWSGIFTPHACSPSIFSGFLARHVRALRRWRQGP